MKRAIFTFFASFLVGFSGAQMLPDSIEYYSYDLTKEEYSEFPTSTEHFSYDPDGNVIERISRWPHISPKRYTYSYSNGKEVENILYEWNSKTSLWFPKEKNQVFRNEFGVDTAEVYVAYDTTNKTWTEGGRKVYAIEYDVNNRPLKTTVKGYNALTQIWTTYEKYEFNYAGIDTVPAEIYFARWEGGAWINKYWYSGLKWQISFSPIPVNLKPTLRFSDKWDGANWVQHAYDSSIVVNGNVEDIFSFSFDMDSQYYFLNISIHFRYDTYGNETSHINLKWLGTTCDTGQMFKNYFIYGSQGEVLERVRDAYSASFGLMGRHKEIYYYGATSLVSAERPLANIYPNPVGASQKFFIQSEAAIGQIQLYSGNGAMLGKWVAPNGEGLDIQGIAPGLYFIRLLDEAGNTSTQSLVIK